MSLLIPLQTLGDTIHRHICPLYSIDERGRFYLHGSTVPFKSGGISFPITAAHVCLAPPRLNLPLFTWGLSGPRLLQGTRLGWEHRPRQTPDIDIALISLSDADVDELKSIYKFSDPSTTSTAREKTPGIHYMVTGYPFARNRVRPPDLSLPSLATYLITGDIRPVAGLHLQGKHDSSHFAIYFKQEEILTPGRQKFRVPRPQGMSGGGVWQLDIDVHTQYSTTPQLVGIAIEYHNDKSVFVASRIQLAIPLIHDLISLLSGVKPADVIVLGETTDKA